MKKLCGFKCISWILVFSIFHLQFSSVAYGGHDKEEKTGGIGGLKQPLLKEYDPSYEGHGKENLSPARPVEVYVDCGPEKELPSLVEASGDQRQAKKLRMGDSSLAPRNDEKDYPKQGTSEKDLRPLRFAPPLEDLEEYLFPQDGSDGPSPTFADIDPEARERIQAVFARVSGGQNLDPTFWRIFHNLHVDLNSGEGISPRTRTAIRTAAAVSATLASGAMALLFLSNGAIGVFLVPSSAGAKFPPFPLGVSLGAGCAGALVWPDNYIFLENMLTNAVHFFHSPHTPIMEDFKIRKASLLTVSVLPRIIGFVVEAFVYVNNTITKAPLTSIFVFALPTGGIYLAMRLGQVFSDTLEGYLRVLNTYEYLCGILQRTFGNPHPTIPQEVPLNGDSVKKGVRIRLAQGIRKAIADPRNALALYSYTQTISQEVAEIRTPLQKRLEALTTEYETLSDKTQVSQEAYKAEQAKLQNQLDMVQWMGELLTLQAYYNFDKEGRHPMGLGHPLFYTLAQGAGAVIGGVASGSIWYGLASMGNSFELSREEISVTATLATFILSPYLAVASAKVLSQLASYVKGYHPIANTPTIEERPLLMSTNLHAAITFLNMIRGIYLSLPTSLLGPAGMVQNGIWPGAPHIGPEALPTTASNMAAWGLVESYRSSHLQDKATEIVQALKEKIKGAALWVKGRIWRAPRAKIANEGETLLDAEERMQKAQEGFVVRAHQVFGEGKDFYPNLQQHLADQYTRIDGWLRRLNGKQILLLHHYLRTPVEDWFKRESGGEVPQGYVPFPEPVVLQNP